MLDVVSSAARPAGGAALGEIVLVAGPMTLAYGALAWFRLRHRHGYRTPPGDAAAVR